LRNNHLNPLQKGLLLTQRRKAAKIFKKMLDFLSASSNFFLNFLEPLFNFFAAWR